MGTDIHWTTAQTRSSALWIIPTVPRTASESLVRYWCNKQFSHFSLGHLRFLSINFNSPSPPSPPLLPVSHSRPRIISNYAHVSESQLCSSNMNQSECYIMYGIWYSTCCEFVRGASTAPFVAATEHMHVHCHRSDIIGQLNGNAYILLLHGTTRWAGIVNSAIRIRSFFQNYDAIMPSALFLLYRWAGIYRSVLDVG